MVLKRPEDMPACVLLTGDTVGQTIGMIRSLGRRGVPVYVLVMPWNAGTASIYAKSRYCKAVHTISRTTDANDACREILKWLEEQSFTARPILMPVTDRMCTYLAESEVVFSEECEVCMASDDVILSMLDKRRACAVAKDSGLKVPETYSATSMAELESLVQRCGFPVVVKPTWWRTTGKNFLKAERCDSGEQLLETAGRLIHGGATILVQEYIPGGDDAFDVYMFYRTRDGRTIHGCTGRKLRQIPPGTGVMASGKATQLPHIARMSDAFLKHIDYRGLGGIEYKRCGQESYFIEMSVRPEAFHMLAAKAGIDLPWLAYSDMVGGECSERPQMQREAYYLNVRSHISLWHKHKREIPALREMLKILCRRRTQLDLWSSRDPMPWVFMTVGWIKELLTRMKKKLLRKAE